MKAFAVASGLVVSLMCVGIVVALAATPASAPDSSEQAVLQADTSFVQAAQSGNKAAVNKILDTEFTWINSEGVFQDRSEVLQNLPKPVTENGSGTGITERIYGRLGVIEAHQGRVYALRIWAKRPSGWRLLHINEITQPEIPEPPGAPAVVTDCINPCKTVPLKPATPGAAAALASWQQMETGAFHHDWKTWGYHVAQDDISIASYNTKPTGPSAERVRVNTQREAEHPENHSNPVAPLLWGRLYDFGAVLMLTEHQDYNGRKPYWASRVWVSKDGRYQMEFSWHTVIEGVPAFSLYRQLDGISPGNPQASARSAGPLK